MANVYAFAVLGIVLVSLVPDCTGIDNLILVSFDARTNSSGFKISDGGIYIYNGDGASVSDKSAAPDLVTPELADVRITDMDVNVKEGSVYFVDSTSRCIYSLVYSTKDLKSVYCGVSSSAYTSIAYDWLSGNLYWVDRLFQWIAVLRVNTSDTSVYRILIQHGLDRPGRLAVDPIAGYMFWFDMADSGFRIERALLDGSDRTLLLTSSFLYLHDMEADPVEQRIYWSDTNRFTIESSKYDGSDRKILYYQRYIYFRSISIDMKYVCVTIHNATFWGCIKKTTGLVTSSLTSGFLFTNPTEIAVSKAETKPPGIGKYTFTTSAVVYNCVAMGCEHLCVNLPSASKCLCKEGYTLNTDGVHCTVTHQLYGKGILVSNDTHLCMFDFRTMTAHPEPLLCVGTTVQSCMYPVLDTADREIFYADAISNSINRYNLVADTIEVLVSAPNVSGLAFDWTDRNLYWSDTSNVKVISISSDIVMDVANTSAPPSYLTIDPYSRTLFWTERGSDYTIYTLSLNQPSKPMILRMAVNKITALFFDVTANRLYYGESNMLWTTDRNGTLEKSYQMDQSKVEQLIIYKQYVVWSDGTDDLHCMALQHRPQTVSLPEDFGTITGLAVFDPDLQTAWRNPCKEMNGGCEKICWSGELETATCVCSYGLEIQPDGKSCGSVPLTENFILAADIYQSKLYQVSTMNGTVLAVDITSDMISDPLCAVYDPVTSLVYWSDSTEGRILRSSLEGKNTTVVLTTGAYAYPTALAIDPSTGHLYYGVSGLSLGGGIGVIQPSTLLVKTLVDQLEMVNSMTIHPSKGIMFYTNKQGSANYISRSSMDGTNANLIVFLKSNDARTVLAIDYSADRLYWSSRGGVFYSTLDGTSQTKLFSNVKNILGLQIVGTHLYYTSRSRHKLSKFDLQTKSEVPFMKETAEIGTMFYLSAYEGQLLPENDKCTRHNGGCSMFCLPREHPSDPVCGCEDGTDLRTDDPYTCQGVVKCTSELQHGTLSEMCGYRASSVCTFECNMGYISTLQTNTLTCQQNGQWNDDPLTVCKEVTCSKSIQNGRLSSECFASPGQQCSYICDDGYIPNLNYTSPVACLPTGQWQYPTDKLCIKQGDIMCGATCGAGDAHSSGPPDLTFSVCEEKCPIDIPNGVLSPLCRRIVGDGCQYDCNTGYKKSIDHMTCLATTMWLQSPDSLCTQIVLKDGHGQPKGDDSQDNTAAYAGAGVASVIVVVAAVAITLVSCKLIRKRNVSQAKSKENWTSVYTLSPGEEMDDDLSCSSPELTNTVNDIVLKNLHGSSYADLMDISTSFVQPNMCMQQESPVVYVSPFDTSDI